MKMFDAGKTRMIGLPYGEKKLSQYVKPFLSVPLLYHSMGQIIKLVFFVCVCMCVSVGTLTVAFFNRSSRNLVRTFGV